MAYKITGFKELCFLSLVANIFTQNVYFLFRITQLILNELIIQLRVLNPRKGKFIND